MEGRRIYVKHPSYRLKDIEHSGTKGMHWGERLYQYEDGSLTPLGRIRYGIGKARVRRVEQAAAKAKANAEEKAEREKRKYQNEDGTLKLRGKIHYKTTNKYALLTDDEIKQQTNRLQLQKNLEDIKKQTSATYRLKNKMQSAAEDVAVAGLKKAGEKIVNAFLDKGVSKLLGTDKEETERAREFAKTVANMSVKEMNARKSRAEAQNKLYKEMYGDRPPKDFDYGDLTDEEKRAIGKDKQQNTDSEEKPKNNQNSPSKSSETKTDNTKSSESKADSSNTKSETKTDNATSSEKKTETARERAMRAYGISKAQSSDSKVDSSNTKADNATSSEKKTETARERAMRAYGISKTQPSEKKENAKITRVPESKTDRALRAYGISGSRIKGLRSSGMTIEEIAKKLNISTSTVQNYLKG